jgi:hypothetical protein
MGDIVHFRWGTDKPAVLRGVLSKKKKNKTINDVQNCDSYISMSCWKLKVTANSYREFAHDDDNYNNSALVEWGGSS